MARHRIPIDAFESLAWDNPGSLITFTSDRAYLVIGKVTYVADLPATGRRRKETAR